ncbi:MAG TPA: GAF domain-containing protein, partial [Thermomicrobiales bacterium]|nr:GAF domain-containing protein [Thermomicrobiales bacterium]
MNETLSLRELADRLATQLDRAYSPAHGHAARGGEPLVESFEAFAGDARAAGLPLEDVMTAGIDTLQTFFRLFGNSPASDPATMRAAGVALASAARTHILPIRTFEDTANGQRDPLPQQMNRLAALHQINRAATANLRLWDMLQQIATIVAEAAEADACSIFLYDDGTGLLTLRAAIGLSPVSVGSATLRMGSGITGRAAVEQKLIAAPDAHRHESFMAHPGIGDEIYTSQVSVPITTKAQNKLVGILNLNTIRRREFDGDELEFLETVAGELAISIENARQYSQTDERLRQKVAELGTLQRVSRILASTLDLADVLRLITEQAVELVHAEAAAIFRIRETTNAGRRDVVPQIEHRVGPDLEMIDDSELNRIVSQVMQTGTAQRDEVTYVDGANTLFCLPLRSARETVGAICFRMRTGIELDDDTLGILQAFSDSAAMAIENAQLYQDAMHSIQTQSALVQEMHHRVRNNLQTVAALLSLQLRSAEDAPWATEIREAISRIQSIAAVHDLLSDERRLAGTTVDVIARMVAEDAHSTLIPPGIAVRFDIQTSQLTVASRQATILSLLINELTANAISHGFRNRSHG